MFSFHNSSLSSSDFSLKLRSDPLLRRLRGSGSSIRKTIQTTNTSHGDARAQNQVRVTVDLDSSSSKISMASIRQSQ